MGVARAEVRSAIVDAFQQSELDRLLRDNFDFDLAKELDLSGGLVDIVDRVLDAFERDGRYPDLLARVAAARPKKVEVQDMFRAYARDVLAGDGAKVELVLPPHVPVTIEREVLRGNAEATADPLAWGARLVEQSLRICSVEVAGSAVAGFLVGPDLVLTADLAPSTDGDAITCTFDASIHVALAADGWLVEVSRELGFALLRLERRFADEPVEGRPRGSIVLPSNAAAPATPIALERTGDKLRVRAGDGDRGVPCFDASWNLVALHRTPIGAIRARVEKHLGRKTPRSVTAGPPPSRNSGHSRRPIAIIAGSTVVGLGAIGAVTVKLWPSDPVEPACEVSVSIRTNPTGAEVKPLGKRTPLVNEMVPCNSRLVLEIPGYKRKQIDVGSKKVVEVITLDPNIVPRSGSKLEPNPDGISGTAVLHGDRELALADAANQVRTACDPKREPQGKDYVGPASGDRAAYHCRFRYSELLGTWRGGQNEKTFNNVTATAKLSGWMSCSIPYKLTLMPEGADLRASGPSMPGCTDFHWGIGWDGKKWLARDGSGTLWERPHP
jgi:hypothetical protein